MRTMKRIGLVLCIAMILAMGFGCAKKQVAQTPDQAQSTMEDKQSPAETSGDTSMMTEQQLEEAMKAGQMAVSEAKVYFDFDKFEIKSDYRTVLKENAAVLKKFPSIRVLVEGHCDARGTAEYNLALGERRARAVKEYLMVLGVPASQLEVVSYGEERPAVDGMTEAAWAKNRRAEFKVIR